VREPVLVLELVEHPYCGRAVACLKNLEAIQLEVDPE
jgi:hypothetical protein